MKRALDRDAKNIIEFLYLEIILNLSYKYILNTHMESIILSLVKSIETDFKMIGESC